MFQKLLILLLLPLGLQAQNSIGLPEIINYSKKQYGAGVQNWDLQQDSRGNIYTANNEGLLSFDGHNWQLYPLPNRTIVRSVQIGEDGRIYVGGQDELGYFAPNQQGKLVFTSLVDQIPKAERVFGDVWDIVNYQKAVYFRSAYQIFQFQANQVRVLKAQGEFAYMGVCNDQLLVQDFKTGLLYLDGKNSLQPYFKGLVNPLPKDDGVTGILSVDGSTAIITTLKNGLYRLRQNQLEKINTANNAVFANDRIYASTVINQEWMALATTNGGVYIIDVNGNIVQQFSRTEGLQNNNILSIFLDKDKNLWLGLNNGIDFIAYNSAIKKISPQLNEESGYAAWMFQNQLYLGTSNGLFTVPLQATKDLSFSQGNFSLVANTRGQSWNLQEYKGKLLLGHHEGAFEVQGQNAKPISTYTGFWNFIPYGGGMVAGNYKGLMLIDSGKQTPINGFLESSRFVAVDGMNQIWVSHPYHGVFKINEQFLANGYGMTRGLPSNLNNHVYKIRNKIVVATEKGVYEYQKSSDRFVADSFYTSLLGNQSIRYLQEDKDGNIWFIHDKQISVIDFSGSAPQVIEIPEIKNKMLSGFEMIYPIDQNNIIMGGEQGFYHINYLKYKQHSSKLQVQIRSLRIGNNLDSTIFGGYFNTVNQASEQQEEQIPNIAYAYNSIHVDFAAAQHGYMAFLEYSFRLKGFENNWSSWSHRTEKEYTNLPPGNYTFEVRARNNLGTESNVASYQFQILAPWYRTLWALLLYFLLGGLAIFGLYHWQKKKFLQQKKHFQEEQQKLVYIHELEINKTESELVALRNERLEADLNFKNTELASSAMHLVKKGEILTKVKNELTQIAKKIDNEYTITELKKMIKTLSEDEHLDEEWEYFTKHFDKVHSDYIVHLKEIHPNITNNEIKLCAYLRMNLSTKEMAQLMNISVRGVEISRYRLRKKLNLPTEVNLFDYLIGLGKK